MTDAAALETHARALAGAAVVCVGDTMLDRFVYGAADRISPEAPIPVVRIERETTMPGGAGNVARNLAALGARTAFVSVVGDDAEGFLLGGQLDAEPGLTPCLKRVGGRPTTVKTRYVAGGQQLLRADNETTAVIDDTTRDAVAHRAEAALADAGALILSDYHKGVLDAALAPRLIEAARAAGRPVVVDPKGRDPARYQGATLLTPNQRELGAMTGRPVRDADSVRAAGHALRRQAGVTAVLVTRGPDGMTLLTGDGDHHFATRAREVYDVSGAGDTVVATVAAGLAAGVPLEHAAALANRAAGIVVGRLGTAVVGVDDLVGALHHQEMAEEERKVVSPHAAADQVARWRNQGVTVAFTNGCFDLLHPGHVSLLRHARQSAGRLVVGLNSDASVARLKGEGRPVQAEAARALVLASLAAVDLVVIFDADTPLSLIQTLHPDVLVKGADYALDNVVGADHVHAYGGRVELAPLAEGYSTSAIVARGNGSGTAD